MRKLSSAIRTVLKPAVATEVFATYWRFAAERQNVFFKRFKGASWPWTNDPTLQTYKFTNAYRASDRVSQYLIRNVIYGSARAPEDVFFRTLLFKLFNRIATWTYLEERLGDISYEDFSVARYDELLSARMDAGTSIYSAAYIMPSGVGKERSPRKHRMHLELLARMMKERAPERVFSSRGMREGFEILRSYPTIGDFLAYQFITDLNYSDELSFSESEFVVPGPGALDGIAKCFSNTGGLTPADLIRFVTEHQEQLLAELSIDFRDLWGRPLQYIDCQNLFCEVSKYARVAHPEVIGVSNRTRIKQRFAPTPEQVAPWYPPKWKLNERIKAG